MVLVRFLEDFDYKPTPRVTIGYQAGWSGTVKRDCADQALAADKAVRIGRKPSKTDVTDDEASEPREA